MGYEHDMTPLIRQLFEAFAAGMPKSKETPKRFAWPRERQKHASRNHRHMAWGIELLRSAAWGTKAEYEKARALVLLDLADMLDLVGLWTTEQLTGIPHGGFYLDGHFLVAMAAVHRGDSELLTRGGQLLGRAGGYMALTSTPRGEVLCCGERMPKGPLAPQQSAVRRVALGVPTGVEDKLDDDTWLPVVGALALQAVQPSIVALLGQDPAMVETFPLVRFPVSVVRWKRDGQRGPGHLARYTDGRGSYKRAGDDGDDPKDDGTCHWVLIDHDAIDSARGKPKEVERLLVRGVNWGLGFDGEPPRGRVPVSARLIVSARRSA